MASNVTVTLDDFYQQFPQFNTADYTDICPQCLSRATLYISTRNKGIFINGQRVLAIYLLTAHLSFLTNQTQQGQTSSGAGLVGGATVDGVSVNYVQIPNMSQWDYWLSLTPYGAELNFLLESLTAVPTYHGGSFERVF